VQNLNIQKYKTYLGIFLSILIFGSPNLLLASYSIGNGALYSALLNLFHFTITSGIIILPLLLFKLPIRKYFYCLAPLAFIVPILIFVILIYQKLPTRWMFYVLFETEKYEILEFTAGMWFWKTLMIVFPLCIIIISRMLIKSNQVVKKKYTLLIIGVLVILFSISYVFKTIQHKSFSNSLKITARSFFRDTPLHTSQRFARAFKTYKSENRTDFNEARIAVARVQEIRQREVYILVIGESARFENWGINGYFRNTSPYLNNIEGLLSFSNIISPSFNTSKSVPIIVTSADVNTYQTPEEKISLLQVFKAAGFKTYWISNQASKGSVVGSIARCSDERYQTMSQKIPLNDLDLLDYLKKLMDKNEAKVFIVVHTQGSHYPYQNRYPSSFGAFTPALEKNQHVFPSNNHKEMVVNSYDNSILLTDYFLAQIIDLLKTDSIVSNLLYVSDHGENLFDFQRMGFGRGYGNISTKLFHVPMFIWSSDEYKRIFEEKWNTLEQNRELKTSTESIFWTFADMAGICWNQFDSSQSLASTNYRIKPRLIINKNALDDYDLFFDKLESKSK
jgi:glucan phosphoethanolaminetransferase (alkaline phosphatase superfamily)